MIVILFINFFLHSNPYCEIRCQEQANKKLVSSCVNAFQNYVNRYSMTPEQAIHRLKSSAIMSKRCSIEDGRIYANQESLRDYSSRCILKNCSVEEKNSNETTESLFSIKSENNNNAEKTKEKIVQSNTQQDHFSKSSTNPKRLKFQPLTCGNDTSCISRDINR